MSTLLMSWCALAAFLRGSCIPHSINTQTNTCVQNVYITVNEKQSRIDKAVNATKQSSAAPAVSNHIYYDAYKHAIYGFMLLMITICVVRAYKHIKNKDQTCQRVKTYGKEE